jgi:hypothetical protein
VPQVGVRAVRLRLASERVPGYNEIDAIGLKTSLEYADQVAIDAPLAHWRLSETSGTTAFDDSGANNGSYVNGVALGQSGVSSGHDKAVLFNGSNQWMQVPDNAALRLNRSSTIEFWAKMNAFANTWPGILGKGNSATGTGYIIWYDATRYLDYKRAGIDCLTSAGVMSSTEYRHFAVVYDALAHTVKWYVNGVLDVTCTNRIYPANTDASTLNLGVADHYGNTFIDEVAIYDYPLSRERILAHAGAGPKCGDGVCNGIENCGSCRSDCAVCGPETLASGGVLLHFESRTSTDGRFTLTYSGSNIGNTWLSQAGVGQYWSNGVNAFVGRLTMQTDGNLVQVNNTFSVVWQTFTSGNPGAFVVVQNDGNAVMYSPTGAVLWSTGTSGR